MSRYTGPAFKKSRRLGFSTLESGKELRKRTSAPGIHGTSRKKLSEYGIQLAEKQKVRIMYGLTEKQFKKTFEAAGKKKGDIISVRESSMNHPVINECLESKLSNVSYVTFDSKKKEGTYVRYPEREELNSDINESLIVEYYNR